MTAKTPVYGLEYLVVGEPVRNTRAALQSNAETIEAALVKAGVTPLPGTSALVAAATAAPTPDTLARRDAAGRLGVAAATDPAHAYRKDQVDSLLSAVPSNDELFASVYLGDAIATRYYVFVAPFALRIAAVSLITPTAVASSTTVLWTAALRRVRAGTASTFATKTTNASDGAGGQAITANTDWNFDAIAFNASTAQFAKGDGMALELAGTGTPPTLARTNLTVRYAPL